MAKGDLVVGTSGANTAVTFTPAAGVEVIIMAASLNAGTNAVGYTSASGGFIMNPSTSSGLFKAPCTNSLSIYIGAGGVGVTSSYGGVQTK